MFRQIFLIPLAGIAAIVLSITASPSHAAPLTTTGIIGDVEQALGTNPILVEEGNRTRARDVGKRREQRSRERNRRPRQVNRSRSERKAQRSERRARKAERRARRAEGSRSERRASRSERRARKAERRTRRAERRGDRRRDKARRHDRRKHAHKRHRHKHKRHRRHRSFSFGYYGYGGFSPYFPYDRYDSYGGYDYGSYDPYYEPRRRTRISCKRARKKLRRNGYRKMRAYDCRGKVYGFYAWRGKYRYKIRVSAYTNRILVARRI